MYIKIRKRGLMYIKHFWIVNQVSAYRVVLKPRYKQLGFYRIKQANSWRPSIAMYGNRTIRNSELVQITSLVTRCMESKTG